jgi:hypothetical protein
MQYIDRLADVLPEAGGRTRVRAEARHAAKIAQSGFNAVGVEPIAALVETANRWLEGRGRVPGPSGYRSPTRPARWSSPRACWSTSSPRT